MLINIIQFKSTVLGILCIVHLQVHCRDVHFNRRSTRNLQADFVDVTQVDINLDTELQDKNNNKTNWFKITSTEDILPELYVVTPTYTRTTQRVDLLRMSHSLALSEVRISWILVEDKATKDVSKHLIRFKTQVENDYKTIKISAVTQNGKVGKSRGVYQRNKAINYILELSSKNTSAAVYFADDDNTYDPILFRAFTKIRKEKPVGIVPVGGSGGMAIEGPICSNHGIKKWNVHYLPSRIYAGDMAGFAILLSQFENKKVLFQGKYGGRLEPEIVCKAIAADLDESWFAKLDRTAYVSQDEEILKTVRGKMDCLIDNAVLVWHTKSRPLPAGGKIPGIDVK